MTEAIARQSQLPRTRPSHRRAMDIISLHYNITAQGLIDRFGPVSDAIAEKAAAFIDNDCVRVKNNDGRYVLAVCDPILGYNSTAHTIFHRMPVVSGEPNVVSCTCQWARMYDRMCSHALAYSLHRGLWDVRCVGLPKRRSDIDRSRLDAKATEPRPARQREVCA